MSAVESTAGDEAIRRAQIEAVGGAFLRTRPLVTALGAALNGALLAPSGAATAQRGTVGALMALLVASFALEALVLRRRAPSAQWIERSLGLTALALGAACALTGGASSPLLPLSFAPLAIALAAFGRTAPSQRIVALMALVMLGLVALATGLVPAPFPPLPAVVAERMTLVSASISITLVAIGVSGLAEAHRTASLALGRTRKGVLDDALARAKLAESTGLRIAHEIRNPLTSIKALVALVRRGEIDPRAQKRLEVAEGEIVRIEGLIEGYLSLARPLEDLVPVALDAADAIREVGAVLEARAVAAGVTVHIDARPAPVEADPRRVREALLNLGSNAIDAMARGGTLTLRAAPEGAGARIVVEDTGPGLEADQLARLGEPLATSKKGGVGLGVLLARAAIAQHGGTLTFESERGAGTRAILALPARPPREERTREETPDTDGDLADRR
jgi:signal transduction histidine kinase